MTTIPRPILLALLLATGPVVAETTTTGITTTQDGNNLKVFIDGQPFTEYRSDKWVPCLYPLMSPGGTHLTRRFPFEKDVPGEQPDHPHHIGFWFTHGDVNGHDFWHSKKGEKIVTKGFIVEPTVLPSVEGTAGVMFKVDLSWMDGDGEELLAEERNYMITTGGNTRTIDVTCRLTAIKGDVTFGDTKEGSFAIRVAPTLRLKGEVAKGGILTSEGLKDDEAWGQRAKWIAYHGPDSTGTPQVIALMDHPDNLRHPTWWHARDYGLLAANPFGANSFKDKTFKGGPFVLKNGESLTQRYKLLLHQGDLASANPGAHWKVFSE